MTTLRLPVNQTGPHFGFTVELDGVTFGLTFRWNDRAARWYLDLADGEGNALVSGVAVVLGVPLFRRFALEGAAIPAGDVMAIDSANSGVEAAYDDLGRRVLLYYFPAADIAAALA